jgi:hypothetical protein
VTRSSFYSRVNSATSALTARLSARGAHRYSRVNICPIKPWGNLLPTGHHEAPIAGASVFLELEKLNSQQNKWRRAEMNILPK